MATKWQRILTKITNHLPVFKRYRSKLLKKWGKQQETESGLLASKSKTEICNSQTWIKNKTVTKPPQNNKKKHKVLNVFIDTTIVKFLMLN